MSKKAKEGYWEEIGDLEVRKKASQALRKKPPVDKAKNEGEVKLNLRTRQANLHETGDSIQTTSVINCEPVLPPNLEQKSCPSMSTVEVESVHNCSCSIPSDLFASLTSLLSRMFSLETVSLTCSLSNGNKKFVGHTSFSDSLLYCTMNTLPLDKNAFCSDLMSDELGFER